MDFIRSVREAQIPIEREQVCDRRIVTDTHAAMDLDRTVSHCLRHLRSNHLDRRDQVLCNLVPISIHLIGRLEGKQTSLFDLAVRARDVLPDAALLGQFAPERDPVVDAAGHDFECHVVPGDDVVDAMEEELHRRSTKGVLEPVFYKGEMVAKIRKFSDPLLMFALKGKRPEIYRERFDVNQNVTGSLDLNIQATINQIYADPDDTTADPASTAIDSGSDQDG